MSDDAIKAEAREIADASLKSFSLSDFIEEHAQLPEGSTKISLNTKAAHRRAELLEAREDHIKSEGASVGGDTPYDAEIAQVQSEISESSITVTMRAMPESEREVIAKMVRQSLPEDKNFSEEQRQENNVLRNDRTAQTWIRKSIVSLTFPNGDTVQGPVDEAEFDRLWDVLHESQKAALEARFGTLSLAKTIFDAEVDAGFPG